VNFTLSSLWIVHLVGTRLLRSSSCQTFSIVNCAVILKRQLADNSHFFVQKNEYCQQADVWECHSTVILFSTFRGELTLENITLLSLYMVQLGRSWLWRMATISRLLKIIGLVCKRALYKRGRSWHLRNITCQTFSVVQSFCKISQKSTLPMGWLRSVGSFKL